MENKENLRVINFNCDLRDQYIERRLTGSWTTWGFNNMRGDYLLNLLNKSSKHNAIIKSKSSMIGGSGWNKDNLSLKALLFLDNTYSKYGMDEILARLSYDLEVFGAFALKISWSNDRKSIAKIEHISPSCIRIQEAEKEDEVDKYWYSEDPEYFDNLYSRRRKNKVVLYPGFDASNRQDGHQILYVKDFRPVHSIYGIPEYISAEEWINLEWEISQFHLSSVQNGFHPSMVINFGSGIPGTEEMDNIIRRLKSEYEGASKGGKVIFTFSDGSQNAPTITPINLNDSDKRFIELNKEVTEGILCGHRVINPTLFGIKTEGELGGTNDILESMAVFNAQYVVPKQKLIEREFNKFARINGIQDKFLINEFKVKLDIQPVVSDLLSILAAPISDDQKINILLSIGYNEETAKSIVVNKTQPQALPTPTTSSNPADPSPNQEMEQPSMVNENVKNLTAKQHQQLLRIIRQYTKGQLDQAQATTLLKTSFGFKDDEILTLLGVNDVEENIIAN